MAWRIGIRSAVWAALLLVGSVLTSRAQAQTTNNTTNNNFNFVPSGVLVDASGVLESKAYPDEGGVLTRQRIAAARAQLGADVTKHSGLRLVSLTRLDRAIADRNAKHLAPTDEMFHLAGLTKVKYVFFYPETNDIVLAGPSEGWMQDLSGRSVGIQTGRPVLELADLAVAMRAYAPEGKKTKVIMCSIDPSAEGLRTLQEFLQHTGSQIQGEISTEVAQQLAEGVKASLGMHNITVNGISSATHFAQVIVEADYRMKLIGIGLERPPVSIAAYVDRVNGAQVAKNALQRWFFVPDYHCVRLTDDKFGMELVGESVKLVGEDEVVNADGSRSRGNRSNKASQQFVDSFTKNYAKLATKVPVYAQLRNCIDLAVVAAFLQQQDFYGKAEWQPAALLSEEKVQTETMQPPQRVTSVVNAVFRGNQLMTPVGGGVQIEPNKALAASQIMADEHEKVSERRKSITLDKLTEGQWWWDAE